MIIGGIIIIIGYTAFYLSTILFIDYLVAFIIGLGAGFCVRNFVKYNKFNIIIST